MTILKVDKSKIAILDSEPLVSGSKNVYDVMILFSADWNGLSKVAAFECNGVVRYVMLYPLTSNSCTCQILPELLVYPGTLRFTVTGTKGEEVILPTIATTIGSIRKGSFDTTDTKPGCSNSKPDTNIAALIAKKGDELSVNGDKLELKSGGEVISSVELQNGSAATPPFMTLSEITIGGAGFFGEDFKPQAVHLKNVGFGLDLEHPLFYVESDLVYISNEPGKTLIYTLDNRIITLITNEFDEYVDAKTEIWKPTVTDPVVPPEVPDIKDVVYSKDIRNLLVLTPEEYAALTKTDSNTLYYILG